MPDLISINEEGIDKLVLDILDYSERINSILNEINDLIISSSNYFSCNTNTNIVNKYLKLQNDINNLKYNIKSYSSDFLKVKKRFRQTASVIADEVRKQTSNMQSNNGI